jgi:hypothetical protein
MNVLVLAQTPKELEWACRQSSKSGPEISWFILRLGDAALVNSSADTFDNCKFLSIEDIEVDSDKVWRKTLELQREFWRDTSDEPRKQLHLGLQGIIAEDLLKLSYVAAVVSSALEHVRPNEVWVPPPWTDKKELAPQAFGHLQWIISFVSSRAGIKCKRPWSFRIFHRMSSYFAVLGQVAGYFLLLLFDLMKIIRWTAVRAITYCRRLIASPAEDNSHILRMPPPIILANLDNDLDRQFDVKRLSAKLADACLVWVPLLGRLAHFTDSLWQHQVLPLYLSGRRSEANDIVAGNFTDVRQVVKHLSPTRLFPLVRGLSNIWYCSAFPVRRPEAAESSLRDLLRSHGMAGVRFVNWRRIVFASRIFAAACDLFKALRPILLVTGDTIDIHRFITLAARHTGVRSLATTHGIQMWSENFVEPYPLADVHCLFSPTSLLLSKKHLPGVTSTRLVCHDSLPSAADDRPAEFCPTSGGLRKRHVLIFTSFYSSAGWTNSLFTRTTGYRDSLYALIKGLAALEPQVEVTIKSHPLNDYYELYDKLKQDFPDVVKRHWREPLMTLESLPAEVVVFYNCVSTSFFYAVHQDIPIIGHWGALTPIARRVLAVTQLLGGEDSLQVVNMIADMLDNPGGDTYSTALFQAKALRDKFIQPSMGGLNEAITFSLEGRASDMLEVQNPSLTEMLSIGGAPLRAKGKDDALL